MRRRRITARNKAWLHFERSRDLGINAEESFHDMERMLFNELLTLVLLASSNDVSVAWIDLSVNRWLKQRLIVCRGFCLNGALMDFVECRRRQEGVPSQEMVKEQVRTLLRIS
jgi:hypothetical protein